MADILNDDPATFASDPDIVDQPGGTTVPSEAGNEFRAALRALNRVYRVAEGPAGHNQISVVEYGAVASLVFDSLPAFNAAAAALSAAGGGQLLVPATSVGFFLNGPFIVPAGVVLKGFHTGNGLGVQSQVVCAAGGTNAGIALAPGTHRGGVEDLYITNHGGAANSTIGLDLAGVRYARIERVRIELFGLGVRFADGSAAANFTAYATLENFEVAHCPIGIQAYQHTNGCAIKDGRIYGALMGDKNEDGFGDGIALDIDSVTTFAIEDVQVESMDLGLRVGGRVGLALRDVYFETGPTQAELDADPTLPPRRWFDVVADRHSIVRLENVHPELNLSLGFDTSLEDSIVCDQGADMSFGARRHFAASAERNLIENGDFHRASGTTIQGWGLLGPGGVLLAENNADFVTAGRSYDITRNGNANDGITTSFVVPETTDFVTVMVRFKNISSSAMFLSAASGSNSGQWQDGRTPNPAAWRIAAFTVEVDPAANGSIVLSITADQQTDGGSIRIDEAWAVIGRTAAAPRAHAHRIELLPQPINIVARSASANEVFPSVDVTQLPGLGGAPRGIIGVVLRLRGMTEVFAAQGHVRNTAVTPYINIPGADPALLAIVTDAVEVDTQVLVRSTLISGGLNFPAGVGVTSRYFVDVVGWVL